MLHDKSLSKRQRLRYLEAKTECTEDPKKHACTWFYAAILDTRDIRLIGSYTLSEFLLSDLLTFTCIADYLTYTIGVCLLAEGLALRRSHLSEAFGPSSEYV